MSRKGRTPPCCHPACPEGSRREPGRVLRQAGTKEWQVAGAFMMTNADLAKIKIHKTIFHDVPKRPRGETTAPVLADLETKVDAKRESMLRRRIIQGLDSKSAYQIEFDPATASKVPQEVQSYTSKPT